MIDKLFFVILVLNATGLFSFIAPQIDVSIGQVSVVLLGLNILYLTVKIRYTVALFSRRSMWGWLFVFGVWPLFTLLYAPSLEVRQIGLQLYFFTLFSGAVVYTVGNGLVAMHRLLAISLVISLLGLILSMLMPDYFEAVAVLADARTEYMGRPFGFFMQPNRLAVNMGFLFIGWFALWRRKNTSLEVFAILAFLLVMLFSGSRTGMLMAVITVVLILGHTWRKRLRSKKYLLKMGVVIACLLGGIIAMSYGLSNMGDFYPQEQGDLIDRMETVLSFKISSEGGVMDDASVQLRLMAQAVYWSLVKEKALLGHGFGSDVYYQETGPIFLSAHSDALTFSLEYGVLYPIVFSLLLLYLYTKRSSRDVENIFQTNSIGQFVLMTISLFVISSIMDSRTFYIIWAMFFAAVYCPRYVFRYDERTKRIAGMLIHRRIARAGVKARQLRKEAEPSIPAGSGMTPEGGICG